MVTRIGERKAVGLALVAIGLCILTPPYIVDFFDAALYVFYGQFTGTNGQFEQVINGWNPLIWDWSIIQANPNPFIITTIMVYGTGFLMLFYGASLLNKKASYYWNELKRKLNV
jgi:hypothetical protein